MRSAVEDRARFMESLRTQPSKLFGPFEQGPQADIEITVDDVRRLAEDPEVAARFAKLHEDSQARMKQCADAYVARHAPTAGTTLHDREQQQAVTPQHPGHRPLR
ncbi:hypothetical protein AB0941_41640 [Streptomyces sp. NPDC013433]|uniref:hypothetical protein n=1 Tax=Streptomyces sp. NPDC013433 TaxID=3155604 RepID=UPI003454D098